MGYVATAQAAPETPISLVVRGTPRPARIVKLPFFATRYYRGK
jgi:aminomethyltransferase